MEATDDRLDNGQVVQSDRFVEILAVRPNRLFVEIKSDDIHPFFPYDGKNLTIYGQLVNYYANRCSYETHQ